MFYFDQGALVSLFICILFMAVTFDSTDTLMISDITFRNLEIFSNIIGQV